MSKESRTFKRSELLQSLRQIKALAEEGLVALSGPSTPTRLTRLHARKQTPASNAKLNFEANERAFVKANVHGMSGSRKFVLILAYLAKGDANAEVPLKDVERTWNRMTSLLGTFNRKYSNDAKESGWVNSKKKGVYVLTRSWRDIFTG